MGISCLCVPIGCKVWIDNPYTLLQLIYLIEVFITQFKIVAVQILFKMFRFGGLWNGNYILLFDQPSECNLCRCLIVFVRYSSQRLIFKYLTTGKGAIGRVDNLMLIGEAKRHKLIKEW